MIVEKRKIKNAIAYLKDSKSIALVSDAGMAGICDPGEDIAKFVKTMIVSILMASLI